MRICDIDRKSEVKYEYVQLRNPSNDTNEVELWRLEVGELAYQALVNQDWAALAAMVPKDVARKSPARIAGAQKRLATIAAKKAAAQGQADAAPGDVQVHAGIATADSEAF